MARPRHESGKSHLALRTNLRPKHGSRQPSYEYLCFCIEEKEKKDADVTRYEFTHLAAFHGHLSLLQKILADPKTLSAVEKLENSYNLQMELVPTRNAGESSSSSHCPFFFNVLTF